MSLFSVAHQYQRVRCAFGAIVEKCHQPKAVNAHWVKGEISGHADKVQKIKQNGVPAFAVIPYEDDLALTVQGDADEATIPPEAVGLAIKTDSPERAFLVMCYSE